MLCHGKEINNDEGFVCLFVVVAKKKQQHEGTAKRCCLFNRFIRK